MSASFVRGLRHLQVEAHSAHGLDEIVLPRLTELAAQVPDMDVNHVALRVEVHVPNLFQQLRAPHHFFGVEQECSNSCNSHAVRSRRCRPPAPGLTDFNARNARGAFVIRWWSRS